MILFHGTNTDIDTIDLSRSLNHKDFGKGFYLTSERTTAFRMAEKKARLFGGKVLSPKRKVQFCKKKSTILAEFFFERTTCKVARCLFASFGCLHTNFALFN